MAQRGWFYTLFKLILWILFISYSITVAPMRLYDVLCDSMDYSTATCTYHSMLDRGKKTQFVYFVLDATVYRFLAQA